MLDITKIMFNFTTKVQVGVLRNESAKEWECKGAGMQRSGTEKERESKRCDCKEAGVPRSWIAKECDCDRVRQYPTPWFQNRIIIKNEDKKLGSK